MGLDWLSDVSGSVGKSAITINDINALNTGHINSRIIDIVTRNYFRYFKVHIHRFCKLKAKSQSCDDDLCVLEQNPRKKADDANKENEFGDIKVGWVSRTGFPDIFCLLIIPKNLFPTDF